MPNDSSGNKKGSGRLNGGQPKSRTKQEPRESTGGSRKAHADFEQPGGMPKNNR